MQLISFGLGVGIFFADENSYRERRQFFIKNVLKDFPAQGDPIEQRILHEVKTLVTEMDSKANSVPFAVHRFFNRYIINTLLSVIVSMRFEPGDPRFSELQNGLEK